jgi:hypothetical protein
VQSRELPTRASRRPATASGRPVQEQAASEFATILSRLCLHLGAPAAALVDGEGETVDYGGWAEAYGTRVMAAELGLVAVQSSNFPWGAASELVIRARRESYALLPLVHGYVLIIRLPRHAFITASRAYSAAVRALCREANLTVPETYRRDPWEFAEVCASSSHGHRPRSIVCSNAWLPVEVIGRYSPRDLHPRECAFRVRTATGRELTLLRERLGHWYADALPEL